MNAPPPIPCVWMDEEGAFRPLPNFLRSARQHYGDGEVVPLIPHLERSDASHRHYFVMIKEAWSNLREEDAARFQTPESLRKWALIQAGYHNRQEVVCATKAEALRWAPIMAAAQPYSVFVVQGSVVVVLTAQSQSFKAMGRERFQASKDAVLAKLSEMIEVTPEQLDQRARAA